MDGVYFVEVGSLLLQFCRYRDSRVTEVAKLPEGFSLPVQFTVSPDGKTLVYAKADQTMASALGKIFPLQHSSDIPLAMKNADDANRSILDKEVKAYGFESVYGPGAKVLKFRIPEVARGSCVGMAANLFRGFFDGFLESA